MALDDANRQIILTLIAAAKDQGVPNEEVYDRLLADRGTLFAAEVTGEELQELIVESRKVKKRGGRRKGKQPEDSVADRLLAILDTAEVFISEEGAAFATVETDGHRETMAVNSKAYTNWLITEHYNRHARSCSSNALLEARQTTAAKALASGIRKTVWKRCGWGEDGAYYWDLGDSEWRAVRVDAEGWQVVEKPPIKFQRSGRETPAADPNDSWFGDEQQARIKDDPLRYIDALVRPAGVDAEEMREGQVLLRAFIFDCFRPGRDHAILNLIGPPGSAKTTTMEVIMGIVDPREPRHTGLPKTEDDFLVVSAKRAVFALDNISHLNVDFANILCRLTTGGGFEKRELHTDGDVFGGSGCLPVIITSLHNASNRDDFQRRTINLHLRSLHTGERATRADILMLADRLMPLIHGAIFDAVSLAIKRLDEVKKRFNDRQPDLGELAFWAEAGGPALGFRDGEFFDAYQTHLVSGDKEAAESDEFIACLLAWLSSIDEKRFEGKASTILDNLKGYARSTNIDIKALPLHSRWIGDWLTAKAKLLREVGIEYTSKRWSGSTRVHVLELKATRQPPVPLVDAEARPAPDAPDEKQGQDNK